MTVRWIPSLQFNTFAHTGKVEWTELCCFGLVSVRLRRGEKYFLFRTASYKFEAGPWGDTLLGVVYAKVVLRYVEESGDGATSQEFAKAGLALFRADGTNINVTSSLSERCVFVRNVEHDSTSGLHERMDDGEESCDFRHIVPFWEEATFGICIWLREVQCICKNCGESAYTTIVEVVELSNEDFEWSVKMQNCWSWG